MEREDKRIILFALVLVVIILGILLFIINRSEARKSLWNNYDDLTYADIFLEATLVEDRGIYWALDDIVSKFIESSLSDELDLSANTVNYKDYYEVLYDNYKKHLGKNGYDKVATNFFSKFVASETIEETTVESTNLIDAIYLVDEDTYLCNLTSKIKQDVFASIVIRLNTDTKSFEIMYIE